MKLSKPNQVVVQLNLKIHRNLNKGDKKFVGYPFIVYRLNSDFVDHIEPWLTQIKKKKKATTNFCWGSRFIATNITTTILDQERSVEFKLLLERLTARFPLQLIQGTTLNI